MSKKAGKMPDKINHPKHYTAGKIEVYDFIEAWNLDFSIGNVVKYVARAPYKGTKLDDLKKAKWYLEKAIEREERAVAERVANVLDGNNATSNLLSWNELSHTFVFETNLLFEKLKFEEKLEQAKNKMNKPG
jgi:hypothetical protein